MLIWSAINTLASLPARPFKTTTKVAKISVVEGFKFPFSSPFNNTHISITFWFIDSHNKTSLKLAFNLKLIDPCLTSSDISNLSVSDSRSERPTYLYTDAELWEHCEFAPINSYPHPELIGEAVGAGGAVVVATVDVVSCTGIEETVVDGACVDDVVVSGSGKLNNE